MKRAIGFVIGLAMICLGIYQILYPYAIKPYLENKEALKQSEDILIGDIASNNKGVDFCVTKVENLKSVGSGIAKVTTDNNFIIVTVKIVNNSSEPYDVNTLNFSLVEGDKEYEHTNDVILSYDNAMFIDTINPSLSKEYRIVYETPTTTEEGGYKLKIVNNAFVEKHYVYITLKEV